MRLLALVIWGCFCLSAMAQWSPYGLGLIQRPNASTARIYLGVTNVTAGTNIMFYTDIFGRIVINATGGSGGTNSGSGTVTNVIVGNLSPLFTSSVANPATAPAITFSLASQSANLVYSGPSAGGAASPTFRSLVLTDLPANIPGSALAAGSVNSNRFDAATLAMFGGGGGGGPANALTNLDTRTWTNWTGIYGNGLGLTNLQGVVTSVTNAGGPISLITTSNTPRPSFKSLSAGSNVTLTDQGTNVVIASTGGGGGGGASGIDYELAVIPPYSEGTNFYLDFGYAAQTWYATNFALRYSTNWPTGSTSRVVNVFIPPTNITRRIYVYDLATNWQTAGLNTAMVLPANQGGILRGNVFTQGETNVMVTFVASKSVATPGESFFNPLGIPGLTLWLDAGRGLWKDVAGTDPVVANGDVVQRWDDQSGNGNFVTNSTSTCTWNEFGAPNSLPSVRFLGASVAANRFRSSTSNLLSAPVWVFIVHARSVTNTVQTPIDSKSSARGLGVDYSSTAGVVGINAGTALSGGQFLTFNYLLASAKFNGANSIFRTNGVVAATGTSGINPAYGFAVGGRGDGSATVFNGNITETLVWTADLTAQNIADIENYLTVRYGPF
jgi:hypothetical protein